MVDDRSRASQEFGSRERGAAGGDQIVDNGNAHARLYRRELPKNVEDAQKIAMRNLEAIGNGKIKLGIPLAPSTSSDPVLIAPGRPVYGDRLKGYVR